MTAKQRRLLLIFSSFLFICASFVIFVRIENLISNFSSNSGYYIRVTKLIRAADYVTIAAALLCPIFSAVFMKGLSKLPTNRGILFGAVNGLLACLLALTGLFFTVAALLDSKLEGSTPQTLALLFGVSSLMGVVYFISNSISRKFSGAVPAFFCVFVSIALLFFLVYLYFEPYTNLNSPVKLMRQASLAATCLFFINEAALGFDKPSSRAHLGLGLSAAFLSFCDAIPNLVAGIIRGGRLTPGYTHLGDLLALASMVYVILRIFSVSYKRSEFALSMMDDIIAKSDVTDSDESIEDDTERLIFEFSGGTQTGMFDDLQPDEDENEDEEYSEADSSDEESSGDENSRLFLEISHLHSDDNT